uniref:Uncharacterized protein n=1 Tax=Anopheles epiroticus TaxID=199890 RepID=A0A182P2L6_9DIPT
MTEGNANKSTGQTTTAPLPEPVCGQISQMLHHCFHNSSPTISAELLKSEGIPDTMEEISTRCLLFTRGMECVHLYMNTCVDRQERKIIENEVYGAKRLYDFLCRDRSFQLEFLSHKECFHAVHDDWQVCAKTFSSILKEEIAKTNRNKQSMNEQYIQFCCARYAYENCVYTSARYKCRNESAIFVRTVAKLLSTEKHFLNCDKIEYAVCSTGTKELAWGRLALLLVSVLGIVRTLGSGRHYSAGVEGCCILPSWK